MEKVLKLVVVAVLVAVLVGLLVVPAFGVTAERVYVELDQTYMLEHSDPWAYPPATSVPYNNPSYYFNGGNWLNPTASGILKNYWNRNSAPNGYNSFPNYFDYIRFQQIPTYRLSQSYFQTLFNIDLLEVPEQPSGVNYLQRSEILYNVRVQNVAWYWNSPVNDADYAGSVRTGYCDIQVNRVFSYDFTQSAFTSAELVVNFNFWASTSLMVVSFDYSYYLPDVVTEPLTLVQFGLSFYGVSGTTITSTEWTRVTTVPYDTSPQPYSFYIMYDPVVSEVTPIPFGMFKALLPESMWVSQMPYGYANTYENAFEILPTDSYEQGFADGFEAGDNQQTSVNGIVKVVKAVIEAPFYSISHAFDFTFFGINFANLIMGILSLLIAFFVIRFVVRFFV